MKDEHNFRSITMSEVMTPEKVNFSGNIHGGYILKLIDQAAYACASRYCGHYVVTLSFDQALFKNPIYVGELVTFFATVNYVGKTSMEVGIKVISENLINRESRHTNSCYVTMVAVDEQMKPVAIQPLPLNTDIQRRRFEEGKLRKEARLTAYQKHVKRKKTETR